MVLHYIVRFDVVTYIQIVVDGSESDNNHHDDDNDRECLQASVNVTCGDVIRALIQSNNLSGAEIEHSLMLSTELTLLDLLQLDQFINICMCATTQIAYK